MYNNKETDELNGIKFDMTVVESEKQTNLFTSQHTKFDITLSHNGNKMIFPYQCNLRYAEPTVEDVVESILLDRMSYKDYEDDIIGFAKEFGYNDDVEKCINVYNACKNISNQMDNILTESEFDDLYKYFDDKNRGLE